MFGISHHRRFTANHTWRLELGRRRLHLKANPRPAEARQEIEGHARIRAHYRVPQLVGSRTFGKWTVLAYEHWPHLGVDSGLLVDEIAHADRTGDTTRLDRCLDDILGRYRDVITATLRTTTLAHTMTKLYGDRAAPDDRLDTYYSADRPWLTLADGNSVRPSDLASTRLIVNGREHTVDFANLLADTRAALNPEQPTAAAVTQGDPTDLNLGWSPQVGPVWFDYDTAGLNSIAGEFACFLLYQRLHGAWLTPANNPAAFRDHPLALATAVANRPKACAARDGRRGLVLDYEHTPSPARQHVLRRYLDVIVHPVARALDIGDVLAWLRPFVVMRLLAVFDLTTLDAADTVLSLGLLADVLHPETRHEDFLGLADQRTEATP